MCRKTFLDLNLGAWPRIPDLHQRRPLDRLLGILDHVRAPARGVKPLRERPVDQPLEGELLGRRAARTAPVACIARLVLELAPATGAPVCLAACLVQTDAAVPAGLALASRTGFAAVAAGGAGAASDLASGEAEQKQER